MSSGLNNTEDKKSEVSHHKLNLETSKTPWRELLPFFAKGTVIYVSSNLDLIDVAHQLSIDNEEKIKEWMKKKYVEKVSDELAKAWHKNNMIVWAVVIKPWILVQPTNNRP
ncbi:MAG: hypothetical protein CMF40_02655 [Legionellales bacterium]|nr:hypothetical protein [Legionellales bacterium]|tara:strand:+ start:1107 stop:1439 length:333 start_codon:yes stop_codon:yes gene_type:complete